MTNNINKTWTPFTKNGSDYKLNLQENLSGYHNSELKNMMHEIKIQIIKLEMSAVFAPPVAPVVLHL